MAKEIGPVSCRIAVFICAGRQLRVEGKFAAPVHRRHIGAMRGIERDIHPCGRVGRERIIIFCAHINREHAPAHELAFRAGVANPAPAKTLAHERARAVGPDQIFGAHVMAPVCILNHGVDMRSPIMKIDQLRVEGDLDSSQCAGMF